MNLQELEKILQQNKEKERMLAGEIQEIREKQYKIIKDKPGKLPHHKLSNCTPVELEQYHNLSRIIKKANKIQDRQCLVIQYIESYINNYKKLLAYNYYISKLLEKPKLNNKPIHYKTVQNALIEIYNNMPQEYKMRIYEIIFLCNHRYYRYEDFLNSGVLALDNLKTIDFTPVSPENIIKNALKKYEETYTIIINAQRQINELWQDFLPPLGSFTDLQYDKGVSPTHVLFNAYRVCPGYILKKY